MLVTQIGATVLLFASIVYLLSVPELITDNDASAAILLILLTGIV